MKASQSKKRKESIDDDTKSKSQSSVSFEDAGNGKKTVKLIKDGETFEATITVVSEESLLLLED